MSGDLSILVVEDEFLILDFMESSLEDGGYSVTALEDPSAALAMIESDNAAFRAIVTDIRLGAGPSGWDLAQRARELTPSVPVVYVTGDSGHHWSSKGVAGSVILTKPFAAAQLLAAVSSLTGKASAPVQAC